MDINSLKEKAKTVRQEIVKMVYTAGSGHPAGSLSSVEIFISLYFGVMKHDPKNPGWKERDRLFLSAGHICPAQYAVMAEAGYFEKGLLSTYAKLDSPLEGHPERTKLPGIEITSGPLGLGLGQAVGYALAARMDLPSQKAPARQTSSFRVYCISSDAEQEEGNHLEAVIIAHKHRLDNLILIIDRNKIQIEATTEEVSDLGSLSAKYKAFGWNTIEINGHDFDQIFSAFKKAGDHKGSPTVIVANTVAGKGVSFMEADPAWHSKAPNEEEYKKALEELK